MPTSALIVAPTVITHMHALNPSSVLDIGAGYGKYGVLFREYLDKHPAVDAIEAWPPYILDHNLPGIYRTVHCIDALEASDTVLNSCDVVYMGDVIEHLDKDAALALLDRIHCPVVINTPVEFFHNPADLPWTETHRSHWTRRDLENTGRLARYDEVHGGIVATLAAAP